MADQLYFTELLGLEVYDLKGRRIGRVEDAALVPLVDDKTLVIASSDLSHYHPYEEARALDRQTVKWICDLDMAALQAPDAEESACGRMPILPSTPLTP